MGLPRYNQAYEGGHFVKHVSSVTKAVPKQADQFQDIVCVIATAIAGMVESKGGSAPLVFWLEGKCDLPDPNP